MDKILKRLLIEGIGCVIFGTIFLASALLNKSVWYEYLLTAGLFISGITFIYKSLSIKRKLTLKNNKK